MPLINELLPALFLRQAENLQWNKLCLDIQIQTTFVIHKSCTSRPILRVCFSVFSPQQYLQPGSWGRIGTRQAYLILPLNNLLASSCFWLRISWAGYCLCDLITFSVFFFHKIVPPWAVPRQGNSCHHLCSGCWAGTHKVCSPRIWDMFLGSGRGNPRFKEESNHITEYE